MDINSILTELTQFLSEISVRNKDNLTGSLVSFIKEIKPLNYEPGLDQLLKSTESSFYFSSPVKNLSVIALNEALMLEENGTGRFAVTDKKLKELKPRYITNRTIPGLPLFVGSMKFNTEHSDEDWKDFNDSSWFVPEIIMCNSDKKNYLIFNYYVEQGFSKTKIAERFKIKAEILLKNPEELKEVRASKIIKSSGFSPKDKKKWKLLTNIALEHINENNVKKVVLARKVDLTLSEELNLTFAINQLKNEYPDCYVFAYHHGKSTFFGASPELLARVFPDKIEIDAVAGSTARGSTEQEDNNLGRELASSDKSIKEHAYVLEHIKEVASSVSDEISFEEIPSVKKLKNIQHLFTRINVELKNDISIMNILKELHPTPAVCGFPKDTAVNLIKKIENQKRGLYSGITGWFNLYNEGEFAVAIRSALTYGNKLIAYAGSGILEGSEPDTEFNETEMKLQPILSLFNEKSANKD
jgi:menaquinone-specific isochorismate synthase